MRTIHTIITLLICSLCSAQIIQRNNSFKFKNSALVIEATIHSADSYRMDSRIYTDYHLQIRSLLKGSSSTNEIILTDLGGTIGLERLEVSPSNSFQVGMHGIFFLNPIVDGSQYEVSFLGQSLVELNDVLSPDQLQEINENYMAMDYLSIRFQEKSSTSSRVINNISPLNVVAGIGETITITGSGFGATGPNGAIKVWTPFANNPNSLISHSQSYKYLSWSDTQIVFKVPSNAGTGQIRVGSSTNFASSTQVLRITSNIKDQANALNTGINSIHLPAKHLDGIQFVPQPNFTNVSAIDRFKEALEIWKCESEIDFKYDELSTSSAAAGTNDGISVVGFDNALGNSVLGVALTSVSACSGNGRWFVADVDLLFNANINFNYSLNPTIAPQFDFYSVALHELGHVRNHGHVLNTGYVMFPSISSGVDRRILHPDEVAGAQIVQLDSSSNQVCNQPLMINATCSTASTDDLAHLQISFYPNPVVDKVFFKNLDVLANTAYVLYDLNGKTIASETRVDNSTLDVSRLSSGHYFIRFNESSQVFQFVKQ